MGAISSIVPVLQAVGGIVSAVGALGGDKGPSTPELPKEPPAEPEGAKDLDAAKLRALKRRETAQLQGGLLKLKEEDDSKTLTKTLLGD